MGGRMDEAESLLEEAIAILEASDRLGRGRGRPGGSG